MRSAVPGLRAGPERHPRACHLPRPDPHPPASGLKDFDTIILEEQRKAPLGRLAEIDDVGAMAAFLASPAAQRSPG